MNRNEAGPQKHGDKDRDSRRICQRHRRKRRGRRLATGILRLAGGTWEYPARGPHSRPGRNGKRPRGGSSLRQASTEGARPLARVDDRRNRSTPHAPLLMTKGLLCNLLGAELVDYSATFVTTRPP